MIKKDKKHNKFIGVNPVTQTMDLIYYDGPIVQATVVKDLNENDSILRLQLDYYADEDFKDKEGYVGVRWTKEDLQHMITLLETTEGILNEQEQQNNKESRKGRNKNSKNRNDT